MAGRNLAERQVRFFHENVASSSYVGRKCIFISHQKDDSNYCREVAQYIMDADFDVYFDENDNDLRLYREANDPQGVTACILNGINNSHFMLCVVSKSTLTSTWVPFEVGYGYEKIDLGILTLQGVNQSVLPQYAHSAKFIIDSVDDLNSFLATKSGKTKLVLEAEQKVFSAQRGAYHPLAGIMNLI
jgi:hypothetical protein